MSSQLVIWLVSLFGSRLLLLAAFGDSLDILFLQVDASLDTLLSYYSHPQWSFWKYVGMLCRNLMELFRDLNVLCQGLVTALSDSYWILLLDS